MSALLDALMFAGAVLDTPGSVVRNTLAGEDPFKGLFAPEERTYGRDLLEQWGVLGENEEGLDMGDVAGFGVDVVADPLSIFGMGKAASGLGRMAGRYADEAVEGGATLGMFGGAMGDFSKYGKQVRQLDPEEAMQLYKPWADDLTPEEADAIRLFTAGPTEAINSTLRGIQPRRPLEELVSTGRTGAPSINSTERVMNEVVPYADSALAKSVGVIPEDVVSYRVAKQIGELNPETARSLIGKSVSDPGYQSTTVTPYGRFYGMDVPEPGKDMLLDILFPEGFPGAYPNAGKLSKYPEELELMTPRGAQLKVLDVKDVPAIQVPAYPGSSFSHTVKLTPEGKPIPGGAAGRKTLFDENALREIPHGQPTFPSGTFEIPENLDDILVPGWEDVVAQSPRTNYTNVLLEAVDAPQFPLATTRRLANNEREEIATKLIPAARDSIRSQYEELFPGNPAKVENALARFDDRIRKHPQYIHKVIEDALGYKSGKLDDVMKTSVNPEQAIPTMIERLKKAGIPLAGVAGASSPLMQAIFEDAA